MTSYACELCLRLSTSSTWDVISAWEVLFVPCGDCFSLKGRFWSAKCHRSRANARPRKPQINWVLFFERFHQRPTVLFWYFRSLEDPIECFSTFAVPRSHRLDTVVMTMLALALVHALLVDVERNIT